MSKKLRLLTAFIVSALAIPSAFADQADKAFAVNDHIQVAVRFATNDLNKRDNQTVGIFYTYPSIPINYKPCANRVRIEKPSAGEIRFVESVQEALGANRYLWIAHNPEGPVIGDSIWIWNANGADVRWTLKGVTGYYLPTSGNDDARIIECKKATTKEAEKASPGGLPVTTPPDDDDNPHVWFVGPDPRHCRFP